VLAKMAATFDVFSGGRLDLGLGAGWNQEEAGAYGIPLLPLRERFDQFEEACEIVHRLLTQSSTTFRGKHYALAGARCEPKPLQKPRPPIVIGGQGERRTLRIAARWADDWNFPGGTPEQFAHKRSVLHRHCAEVGRDPAGITCSTHVIAGPEPQKTAEQAAAFAAAGADHLCLYFFDCSDPALLGRTTDAVLAALRSAGGGG
jgi:alkanesulfonate monooxygenase SsuD/methylene tetrahydromethanopterin reductase-like flavin-dependent oxidoreductase (luciferase family)